MQTANRVLIIDDAAQRRHDLSTVLQFMGYHAKTTDAATWQASINTNANHPIALLAIFLGDIHTAESTRPNTLASLQQAYPGVPIVCLDESSSSKKPVSAAINKPVVGTMHWPCDRQTLLSHLHRGQAYQMQWRQTHTTDSSAPVTLFRGLVGNSGPMSAVRTAMAKVAQRDVNVLITGESGVGKEVVARNLHEHSNRRHKPFIPVNCGAIPTDLLESELFGHEKGAFTGAVSARKGRFELAQGGTLFLDEVGDMPLPMQVKLLRVLQERTIERVGGTAAIAIDIRIIAATHKPLDSLMAQGQFREDLYYRLHVFPIAIPAVRERPEDIPVLLDALTRTLAQQQPAARLSDAAVTALCHYHWPGNVREMANLLERLAIMQPDGIIGVNDLPPNYRHPATPVGQAVAAEQIDHLAVLPAHGLHLKDFLTQLEKSLIQQALSDCNRVVARAADKLHIHRTTLVEKMRKHGLQRYAVVAGVNCPS